MATTERHQEISARFLEQAETEARSGDLLQASEKAWGAVAHYVNSVAREQDWPVGSHRNVNENASRLLARGDSAAEHIRKLSAVNALHANFYEDFFTEQMVRSGIEDARGLIDVLRSLNPNPPMRSSLGVGTRGEGRGMRRSALDSDKWGRWRPLVVVGGADGGPGQRRWGGVGGTACMGRQSRTGPMRLYGAVG